MERRPLAPVFLSLALSATAFIASSVISSSTPSILNRDNDLWFSGGHSGKTGVNPDGGQYRYRIDALSQYEDGDVLAVSLP